MHASDKPGFSLKVFLPSGDPAGLKVVDKSNWTGTGLVIPRPLLPESRTRAEYRRAGVYVLIGERDAGRLPNVYVGEGDPAGARLDAHHRTKDNWSQAVLFTSKDGSLNKAHVQHLESQLISAARDAKRCNLENINSPNAPSLTEADEADMASFLADMLLCLPVLGVPFFERPAARAKASKPLTLKAKGVEAKGYETSEGFVVLRGSMASAAEVRSISGGGRAARADLLEQGVLTRSGRHLLFEQDFVFNSPSLAAGVVLGNSANGREFWRDASGSTLKEIQERQAGG